jgi:RHS repeat-associated protein
VRFETTAYSYYNSGDAISSSFAGGADATSLAFNFFGSTALTTPLGAAVTLNYTDSLGVMRPSSSSSNCGTQCNQSNKTSTYDVNGYPTTTTDFNGNVTKTTYDANGLLVQQIDASGTAAQRTTNTTWNTTLRVPLISTVLDASGATVAFSAWSYNSRGQATAQCAMDPAVSGATAYVCGSSANAPAGVRQQRTTYCDAIDGTQCPLIGLPLVVDGPRTDVSDVTAYAYFLSDTTAAKHGDLKSVTNALGQTTTILGYDGDGRVLSQQDANGTITTFTYYPRGWLHTRTVGGETTTITYTPYGAVASVTDPDNVTITYGYDGAHRLTDITDAQGNVVHYTLDAAGNRTAEQTRAASGTVVRSLSRTFNKFGQLTKVTDGLNHTVFDATVTGNYDGNNNLVHSVDGLGVQHQQGFDALNRLVSSIDNYNGTDTITKNTTSTLTYDALDHLKNVADPIALSTMYGYDGLGNRTSIVSPDTGTSSDTHDAAGNRLVHTDAKGVISTSSYDGLNRLAGISYTDTSINTAYVYDESNAVTGCTTSSPIGHLTRIVETAVTTVYCYDARGNITRKQQITASGTDNTLYAYTPGDRLQMISQPSGSAISYSYNNNGQISTVQVTPVSGSAQTVASAIAYLPFGPINSYTLGNGQTITRTYDANYAFTDLVSPAFNLHLARDAMGQIVALGNAPGGNPAIETFVYDPLYRLTTVADGGAALASYTYNKAGDRLSKTSSGLASGAYLYTAGTHQLASIGSVQRANDANGNTTGSVVDGETFGFGYNGRNRLAVAQRNGQTVGTYTYNGLGQRIAKVATFPQADTERYVYDESGHLTGEYGDQARDYVWLGDIPVAVIDSGGVATIPISVINYITADYLGTPRVVSDQSGNVIWLWAYQGNPFGEQQPSSTTGYVLNLRYPGQYYDAETGINYNYFRAYEPATGRYLQSDPIGLAGGLSTYAYADSTPLMYIDLFGTQARPTPKLGGSELNEKLQDVPDTLFGWWPANWYKVKNSICLLTQCTHKRCDGTIEVYTIKDWVPHNPTVGEVPEINKECVCVSWEFPGGE